MKYFLEKFSFEKFPYGVLVFFLGIFGVVVPSIFGDKMPGDLGDPRFNAYVLEHFFLALTGKVDSFVDAGFFYPLPKTILFSETHWGSGLIYSYFRYFDADVVESYVAWLLVGYSLNYWAAFYVFRKVELSSLASAIGAFIFAFGLPMVAQHNHTQLILRLCVPLAFLSSYRYLQSRDLRYAVTTSVLVAWQLLISVYSGLFLVLFLLFFVAAWFFAGSREQISAILPQKFSWKISLPLFFVAAALLVLFALPYLEVKNLYGFGRSYAEITVMLPRIQSYFLNDNSLFCFFDKNNLTQIPVRPEHQMFVGVGALLCLVILFLRKDFRSEKLTQKTIIAVALMMLMTFSFNSISLYYFIIKIPGFSSLRAISREILIFLFPVGLLVGVVIDRVKNLDSEKFSAAAAIFILSFLIIAESVLMHIGYSSKKEWDSRLEKLQSQFYGKISKDSILLARTANVDDEIDAMFLAQKLGIKTLNGYTGNFPIDFMFVGNCEFAQKRVDAIEHTMRVKFDPNFRFDRSKIIYANLGNCTKTVAN